MAMDRSRFLSPSLSPFWFAAALAALTGTPALAKPPAKAAPAKTPAPPAKPPERTPAAELSQLAFLAGSWSCDARPAGADVKAAFHSTLKVAPDLKNFWYGVDYEQKDSGQPFVARGQIGYTTTDKKFVFVTFNTLGGVVTLSSSGPEGDKLVFTGAAVGIDNVPTRYTFAKEGDKGFTGTLEAKGEKEWFKLYEERCTHAAK